MKKYNNVILSLGGNLNNVKNTIDLACIKISNQCGLISYRSSFYETKAWCMDNDTPNFTNIALKLETNLSPINLLCELQSIEKLLGRIRNSEIKGYINRTIDIDIIFIDNIIIESEKLTIPHPLMQNREFVLIPISEIDRSIVHPILKKNITQLLEELK